MFSVSSGGQENVTRRLVYFGTYLELLVVEGVPLKGHKLRRSLVVLLSVVQLV